MIIRTLILLIFWTLSIVCYGQLYDKVNIYAIHIETSFTGDNIDADYIRVNHKYKFTSTDRYYIEDLSNYFFKDIDSLQPYFLDQVSSTIRVVIDFIHRERITSFVLMDMAMVFYISESPMKQGYYFAEGDEICKVNEIIPFFYLLHYRQCD